MNQGLKKIFVLATAIVVVIALFYYLGAHHYISLEQLQAKSHHFRQEVAQNYTRAAIMYCIIFTVLIAIGVPASGPCILVAGYLFGVPMATVYSLISATVGAVLSFIVVRYALGNTLQLRYKEKMEKFSAKFKTHGANYLLTLYLLMFIPYIIIVVLAALANVPLSTFVWTTFVGCIPVTLMYAIAGQQLGSISATQNIFSPSMIGLIIIFVLLALLPIVLAKFKQGYDL